MDAALAMLGRRAHPAARVRERIAERFGTDAAERTIARLRELRLLDDRAFAEAFARDRFERAGYGRERIRADLRGRGIAPTDVEAAVAAVVDPARERATAQRALERFRRTRAARPARRAAHPGAAERRLRDGAFRHLVGRGFPLDLVRDLLRHYDPGDRLTDPSDG